MLAGGVSNKTVLVERAAGGGWVLKQALPKLRTQADWFSDPARIRREAEGLRWLPRFAPPGTITPLVFEDPDQYLLAMEVVPQPHDNWKSMLLAGWVDLDHIVQFGRLLAWIHARSAGDPDVAAAFEDRAYFESLRIEPYYAYTATQVPQAAEFLYRLSEDCRGRRFTLVHGDYSPKNVLVHAGRLHLLDHEVIHYGDPAFDLGFALTHLLSKANHLPAHRYRFVRAAALFLNSYWRTVGAICDGEAEGVSEPVHTEAWAFGMSEMTVSHTLACLLARVAGRSPLEYLDDAARERQRSAALALMARPPETEQGLFAGFLERL